MFARDLRARYGSIAALRGLTFSVSPGERVAICGPNGAGKTTLLRVLSGAIRPSAGELRLGGLDPARHAAPVRAMLGILGHQTYLFGELTVAENLRLYGRLYGVSTAAARLDELLEQVGLAGRRTVPVDSLSRGLQQRLAIARAVLHDPPIMLLDEPETGLDLAARQLLETILVGGGTRRTVLMATHNLDQARRLCERALVLADGRLVDTIATDELDTERLAGLYRGPAKVRR